MHGQITTFIRNVDFRGRILIPHELRKSLDIKPEDTVSLERSGSSVVIRKCQLIKTLETEGDAYIYSFASAVKCGCLICSPDYVVSSGNIHFPKRKPLHEAVKCCILKGQEYLYSKAAPMDLFGEGRHPINAVYPITKDKQPAGAVILLRVTDATSEQLACARMLADILSRRLSNQ